MQLYFDCFSGISGDMVLGAFIDLGVPVKWLQQMLSQMPLTGFDISSESIQRMGIHAQQAKVVEHDTTTHRHYGDILALIDGSSLPERVKKISKNIFHKLAVAEAGIHHEKIEEVHFHEVGGIDAIVDIVGAALCMDYLDVEKAMASSIPLGRGFVTCRHGTIPIPAPATVAILQGVPTYGTEIPYELVTPTGAAIITTLAESFGPMPEMVLGKSGYGAGQRDLENRPNLLRIISGNLPVSLKGYLQDEIVLVETSIDDMNPELFGFVMNRLFEDGALDVYWIPIYMKKNRPGTMVQVLCREEHLDVIVNRILSETTSIGVRYYSARRHILSREYRNINTSYGEIQVKCITYPDGRTRYVPEYDICQKIALQENIPIQTVYETIQREISDR